MENNEELGSLFPQERPKKIRKVFKSIKHAFTQKTLTYYKVYLSQYRK